VNKYSDVFHMVTADAKSLLGLFKCTQIGAQMCAMKGLMTGC
jgi:hypothetical protein